MNKKITKMDVKNELKKINNRYKNLDFKKIILNKVWTL